MKSIGVLTKEKKLMDSFIELKKNKNEDSDEYEMKKQLIEIEISKIQSEIEFEIIDLETYKQSISNNLQYEQELLKLLELDKNIKNKESLRNRIQSRIDIIKDELEQQVEVEEKPNEDENVETTDKEIKEEAEKEEVDISAIITKMKAHLEEYREAIDYFIIIESSSQAEDARKKAKLLNDAIKKLENEETNLNEFDLPLALTPDFICGCSRKERINQFATIIKQLIGKKNELSFKLKSTLETLQSQVSKKDLLKRKDEIKATLDSLKSQIKRIAATIKKLKEMVKDPWTPAPLFTINEIEEKIEKVNEEVAPNTLSLSIGELTYSKSNVFFQMVFHYANEKTISEYINQKGDNKFNYSSNLKVDKFDLKSLNRKILEINMYQKSFFCCCKAKKLGEVKIRLEDLKSKSQITGFFEIMLEENKNKSKNKLLEDPLLTPKLFVSIKLRNPIAEKEYEEKYRTELEITKYIPSFKSDFRNVQKEVIVKPTVKPQVKQPDTTSVEEEIIIQAKPQPVNVSDDIKIDPNDFTSEELDNPDTLKNLNSLKVLQMKTKTYEDEISKIEGRAPKELRDKYLKCKVKCKTLENEIQSGNITIDQYVILMKAQLDHDRKLFKYFEINNQQSKMKLVSDRIPILISELQEAIDYAKTTK